MGKRGTRAAAGQAARATGASRVSPPAEGVRAAPAPAARLPDIPPPQSRVLGGDVSGLLDGLAEAAAAEQRAEVPAGQRDEDNGEDLEDQDYGHRRVYYRGGPLGDQDPDDDAPEDDDLPEPEQPAKRPRHDMQALQSLSAAIQNLAPEAQAIAVRSFFNPQGLGATNINTNDQPTSAAGPVPSHRRSSGEVASTGQTVPVPLTPASSTGTNVFVTYRERANKIVGLAVSHVVGEQSGTALSKPSLMAGYQETRQLLLEFDAMHQFLSVHDPKHEHFSVWWAYEPKRDLVLGETLGGWQLFQLRRGQRLGRMSTLAWDTYMSAAKVTNLLPAPRKGKEKVMEYEMTPLKTWCLQILGPEQKSTAYRKVRDPFDNLPFLLAVAQTFNGVVNLQTLQVVQMPVISFEALSFVALSIKMHLMDPFQERQRGQKCEPRWKNMMEQLEAEVAQFGGWNKVNSVKVDEKNATAEFPDL